MQIRKMIEEDIPQLALLYKQFWGESSSIENMYKLFNKLKRNPNYIFLSAVDNNILAGSVMGIICEELYGECKPFMILEDLIVDIDYRRKGIGKLLIEEIEKYAKEANCTQILFVTENMRKDACDFYASMGFNPDSHKGFKKLLK
ncbi:MAG: GNAT family N-acetyltransferase [Spirochaetes bacterium GWC1_27_15]|nr:MAG: GNAT family N-acetyltransferase [Spirochaetes bacterium GWB1_27_13]OHD21276.1 MAG: GNAT family N-acetyltransferase [Spirochaetes bacterium GWC1_27_15]